MSSLHLRAGSALRTSPASPVPRLPTQPADVHYRGTLAAAESRQNPSCVTRPAQLSQPSRATRSSVTCSVTLNSFYKTQDEEAEYVEEDFYSILGVNPRADAKQVKLAYYNIMRTAHPDKATDEEATNFCALLNEIYETLSDPYNRALYDQIAGFSVASINPFQDTSYERDQAFVDEVTCIGCRNCVAVCPKTFAMEEEYGRAHVKQQRGEGDEQVQEAMDTCPVNCIYWVTAPQLSLLESAMGRMERVATYTLRSGFGHKYNKHVFSEASIAWEKRQAMIRNRLDAEDQSNWVFWNNTVQFTERGSMGSRAWDTGNQAKARENEALGDKDSRSIAALAARAARSARTWRRYQEVAQAARRQSHVLTETASAYMG